MDEEFTFYVEYVYNSKNPDVAIADLVQYLNNIPDSELGKVSCENVYRMINFTDFKVDGFVSRFY